MSSEESPVSIVLSTTQTNGNVYFEDLVHTTAVLLGATYGFVAKYVDESQRSMTTLAVCAKGEFIDNFTFDVNGTPCLDTLRGNATPNGGLIDWDWSPNSSLDSWSVASYLGSTIVDSYGTVVGLIAVMRDQPKRFSLEDEKVLRVAAARASAELVARFDPDQWITMQKRVADANSLNESVRGVVHDLNNILMTIRGNTEMLPDGFERKSVILAATDRAVTLGRSLLASSTSNPTTSDLGTLVEEIADLTRSTYPKVTVIVERYGSPTIYGHETQIYRMILNLVANAIDAIGNHSGTIKIGVRELATTKSPAPIELTVSDTGDGIDSTDIGRILERGFTTHSKTNHYGIGLTEVQRIVDQHTGSLAITSEPGNGTTFRIILPQYRHTNSTKGA